MRHLRSVTDATDIGQLDAIMALAEKRKQQRREGTQPQTLRGKTVGMLFERPSTRTRVSFEAGVGLLGGTTVVLQGRDTQLHESVDGAEPLRDFARVLGSYVDALVVRPAGSHKIVEEMARHAGIPVINGHSDIDHPCQLLSDYFTVRERRENVAALRFVFVGDAPSMIHGLLGLSIVASMQVAIATPRVDALDATIVARARQAGTLALLTDDPHAAVVGADVVMTAQPVAAMSPGTQLRFQVNESLLRRANADALVLHPLPATRGHEITDDVLEGMHSLAFDAAANRLVVQQAILETLLSPA
jgi:ornithine carbamoyltransferase